MRNRIIAAAFAALFTLPVAAHDYTVGALTIDHPVARETTMFARATGGFMTITNASGADDRLIAVESDAARRIELHLTENDNGVMRMREQEGGILVPANGSVVLKPGSYHVMFMGINEPFKAGETREATLVFETAGRVDVVFNVEEMGGGHGGHDHSGHDHGDHEGHDHDDHSGHNH